MIDRLMSDTNKCGDRLFMSRGDTLYKGNFHNCGKLYELHAKKVHASAGLLGFVEEEGLMFDNGSTLLVDPTAERLKAEFAGPRRRYLPMHSVMRIEEVEKQGSNKISPVSEQGENVTPFPAPVVYPKRD